MQSEDALGPAGGIHPVTAADRGLRTLRGPFPVGGSPIFPPKRGCASLATIWQGATGVLRACHGRPSGGGAAAISAAV